jgi:intracellular sulfur oxidation DsrE/DsrF family protein
MRGVLTTKLVSFLSPIHREDDPMTRTFLGLIVALSASGLTVAQPPTETKLIFPIIPKVGGVVPLPKAAEQPRKGAKIVFDITADAKPADVSKGLERVARLLNLYGSAGLKAADVKVAIVFHGESTKSVLNDATYLEKFGVEKNPNLPVLRDLQKAGVDVFVCGQALNYKGFKESEVVEGASVALAALTVIVNRQADGYAYIPLH